MSIAPASRPRSVAHIARACAIGVSLLAVQAAAGGGTAAAATQRGPIAKAAAACPGTDLVPTAANQARVAAATLCLVNAQRTGRGLGALRAQAQLTRAAKGHTRDMIAGDYFAHVSPAGRTLLDWVEDSSYIRLGKAYELGENIGLGTLDLATPASIVTAWMDSPGHRRNILNGDFTDSGIGIVAAAPGQYSGGLAGATYTQQFGARG